MIQEEFYSLFKSMGAEIAAVIVYSNEAAVRQDLENLRKEAENFERRFSRFLAGSELNALNNSSGNYFQSSREMIELMLAAKKAHELTNGIFDPTVISSLEAIGYDKDFDIIKNENSKSFNPETIKAAWAGQPKFADVLIDNEKNTIKLPKGARLDFGGIAKGFFVDTMAKEFGKKYENFWISAGGDIFLKGRDKNGKNWELGVQNPLRHDQDILTVKCDVAGSAVATSGTTKRGGGKEKFLWHHLIDPRAGLPANTDILAATAITDSVWLADISAKTIIISGENEARESLKNLSVKYLWIDKDLKISLSESMKKYVIEA